MCVTLPALFLINPADAAGQGKPGGKSAAPKKAVLQKTPTVDLVKISKFDTSGKATAAVLKIARTYHEKRPIGLRGATGSRRPGSWKRIKSCSALSKRR